MCDFALLTGFFLVPTLLFIWMLLPEKLVSEHVKACGNMFVVSICFLALATLPGQMARAQLIFGGLSALCFTSTCLAVMQIWRERRRAPAQ